MCLTSRQSNCVPKVGTLDLAGKVRGRTSSIALPYTYRRADSGRPPSIAMLASATPRVRKCHLSLEMLDGFQKPKDHRGVYNMNFLFTRSCHAEFSIR